MHLHLQCLVAVCKVKYQHLVFSSSPLAALFFCFFQSILPVFFFLSRWTNAGSGCSAIGSYLYFADCARYIGSVWRTIVLGSHVLQRYVEEEEEEVPSIHHDTWLSAVTILGRAMPVGCFSFF